MLSFLFGQKIHSSFLFFTVLLFAGQVHAAGVISGTIWNDINANQINESE